MPTPNTYFKTLEAARLFYEQGRSRAEIAKELQASPSSVSRWLSAANAMGLVQHSVVRQDDLARVAIVEPRKVQQVEQELEDRFSLRRAVVVEVPPTLASAGSLNCRDNEDLHRILGAAAGRYVLDILRPGDVLGVGTGLSVHYLAETLQARRKPIKSLTVASLAGGTGVYAPEGRPPSLMSANGSAILISQALEATKLIEEQVRAYQAPSSMHTANYDDSAKPRFTVALIGVGAVAANIPNCFKELQHDYDDTGRALAAQILEDAELIRESLKESGLRPWGTLYNPLGDILRRPFVVDPPVPVQEVLMRNSAELLPRLRKNVEELAPRVYAASDATVARTEHVVLIAGSRRKAFPLWHLLTRVLARAGGEPIDASIHRHSLITDYWTAMDLVTIASEWGGD